MITNKQCKCLLNVIAMVIAIKVILPWVIVPLPYTHLAPKSFLKTSQETIVFHALQIYQLQKIMRQVLQHEYEAMIEQGQIALPMDESIKILWDEIQEGVIPYVHNRILKVITINDKTFQIAKVSYNDPLFTRAVLLVSPVEQKKALIYLTGFKGDEAEQNKEVLDNMLKLLLTHTPQRALRLFFGLSEEVKIKIARSLSASTFGFIYASFTGRTSGIQSPNNFLCDLITWSADETMKGIDKLRLIGANVTFSAMIRQGELFNINLIWPDEEQAPDISPEQTEVLESGLVELMTNPVMYFKPEQAKIDIRRALQYTLRNDLSLPLKLRSQRLIEFNFKKVISETEPENIWSELEKIFADIHDVSEIILVLNLDEIKELFLCNEMFSSHFINSCWQLIEQYGIKAVFLASGVHFPEMAVKAEELSLLPVDRQRFLEAEGEDSLVNPQDIDTLQKVYFNLLSNKPLIDPREIGKLTQIVVASQKIGLAEFSKTMSRELKKMYMQMVQHIKMLPNLNPRIRSEKIFSRIRKKFNELKIKVVTGEQGQDFSFKIKIGRTVRDVYSYMDGNDNLYLSEKLVRTVMALKNFDLLIGLILQDISDKLPINRPIRRGFKKGIRNVLYNLHLWPLDNTLSVVYTSA